MASSFDFEAEVRSSNGSGAARALRREGKIPAIIYGGGEPVMITLNHKDMVKSLENEAVYSHVLNVVVDGKAESAILKDIQRHPSRPIIMHVDFQRVSKTEKIKVHVPLHFDGEAKCPGVKAGGVLTHNVVDVEVSCLPQDLPEFLSVDVSALEVGSSVHLSEIVLPGGIEITALLQGEDHDLPVATVQATRGGASEESDSGEAGESAEG